MPHIVAKRRYTFRRRRLWILSKAPSAPSFSAYWAGGANSVWQDGIKIMKKNVASQKIGAQLVSASDGSAFTGSVTVYVTGDAGTQAVGSVGSGACTHEGNGYHTYAPAQAETNYDLIAFTFTGTGAIPVTIQVYTSFPQTGDSYAEVSSGTYGLSQIKTQTAAIEVDTQDIQSRLPAALVGGRIDANVGAISSDSTAADNAESFFDGTGYAGTNNVIPTVTTLTNAPSDSSGVTTLLSRIGGAITISGGRVDANVTYFGGSAGTFSSGRPEVNATHWGGTAVASALVRGNLIQVNGNTTPVTNFATVFDTDFVNNYNTTLDAWNVNTTTLNGQNVSSSATVDFDVLTSGATAATTYLDATISSRSTVTTAQVNAEVDTALADINLDHLVKNAVDTNFATTVHLDSVVGHLADAGTTATFDRTTDALEVLGAATAPSAATIADAVWDEALSGHLSAGSTGEALNAAGSAGDPWTTTLPGSYTGSQAGKILSDILVDTGTTLQAELDGIQADTEDIQSRLPAALVSGRMDVSVGAMAANVLTASALATDAVTEIQSGLSTLDAVGVRTAVGLASANLDTQLSTIDTVVDAIKVKTDYLPSATAGAAGGVFIAGSNAATTVNITGNITGNLSGSVGSVTGSVTVGTNNDKTGYTLSTAGLAAFFSSNSGTSYASAVAGSVVKEIADNAGGSGLTAGAIADAVWDEASADHNTAGTMGAKMNSAAAAGDPLSSEVPGDYAGGTAGYVLGQIGSGTVTFSGPVISDTDTFEVIQGDDYLVANGRSFNWTFGATPDLTDSTVVMLIQTPSITTLTGTKSGEGTSAQMVKFEMTKTLTASLDIKNYAFDIQATLDDGSVVTLVRSTFLVRSQVS